MTFTWMSHTPEEAITKPKWMTAWWYSRVSWCRKLSLYWRQTCQKKWIMTLKNDISYEIHHKLHVICHTNNVSPFFFNFRQFARRNKKTYPENTYTTNDTWAKRTKPTKLYSLKDDIWFLFTLKSSIHCRFFPHIVYCMLSIHLWYDMKIVRTHFLGSF